jgi:hypothetical protein
MSINQQRPPEAQTDEEYQEYEDFQRWRENKKKEELLSQSIHPLTKKSFDDLNMPMEDIPHYTTLRSRERLLDAVTSQYKHDISSFLVIYS